MRSTTRAGSRGSYGGMHFGFSTDAGVALGTQVAQWVGQHHFARRD